MTISASGLKVGAGTFFSACARGAAFAVLGLVAVAGASTRAVAASVTDWASRTITITPTADAPVQQGGRTVLHYSFRPDAASRLAWTNDSPVGYLNGFENPNRVDFFAVALPKGLDGKSDLPTGRGLVVQLHGRNGGNPGDASMSVIGNTGSKDSVFYAPDDCFALNLECLENVLSDFWFGSHPPAQTVIAASTDHMGPYKRPEKYSSGQVTYSYEDLGMTVVGSNDKADYNHTVNPYEQYIHNPGWGMIGEMYQGPRAGSYVRFSRRNEMSCIKWNTIHESAVVKKLMDTIEWVVRTYKIDRNRIYLTGNSMGGQAALALGLTHGEVFAAINANVPATIWFAAARLGLVNEDGSDRSLADVRQPGCDPPPVFDWSGSDDEWSRRHDVIYRNADRMRFAYTGWWGDYGHVSSVATARSKNDLVLAGVDFFAIRKDAPYAVFTESSCNTDLPWPEKDVRSSDVAGTPPPVIVEGVEKTSGYLVRREGTPAIGQWNAFLKGEVKEDSATQFAADIWIPGADELPTAKFERPSRATANVSFRRIQNFPHGSGAKARWSFGGGSGVMTLDRCGLFTLEQVQITGQKQRLTLTATTDALTPAASFTVPAVATSGQFGKATVALNVTDMAGSDSFDYVIEKSESADFASSETVALGTVSGPGRVTRDISGFEKGKSYYLRARLDAGSGAGTTLVTSFTTRDASRAKVTPPKIAAQTYTGSPLTAAVPSDARWRVVSNPPVTAAGTHAVRLELTEPDANQWSVDPVNDAIDVDFVIEKAQPVWTVEPSLSKYYWGAADDPATYVPGTASFGTATAVPTIDGAAFTGTYPTTGGRYAFTVTIPEAENWTELVWTKDFTVSEASVPTLNGFTGATDNFPVGGDTVLVFSNAAENGSFTLSGPTAARILVVAGGGAGGPRIGGGGGAGGVIAERDVTLPAGTYVCRPGLGGSGTEDSYNGRGRSGKDSVLSNLTATVAYVAKGGGGGGGSGIYSATWFLPPSAGGSSGGGMPRISGNGGNTQNKSPAPSVSGQGNRGGDGALNGYAGGGGGAGAAGGAGSSTQPGNGGDGLLDDITGVALRYGAGGGGSRMLGAASEATISFASAGGLGGAGGGGNGATEFKNGSATDGSFYGAGGGGGAIEGNSGGTGGKGFQGVVIVRLSGSGEPPPVHVHTPTDVVAVPATCTAAGVTAGTKCASCGAILSGCEPIEKLGHDWGEWVTNTPPQIGVAGEATRTCRRTGCDAKETQVIPALENSEEPEPPPQPPEPPQPSGEGIALDQIHWTNAETNWVGGDLVITWKTPGEGSLTLDAAANVRLLAVGGGGSGARNNTNGNAGGGGAGGFADFTTAFASGTYAIEVGKGGAAVASVSSPNYSADGKAGGATSVRCGSLEIVTANGGAGGFCQLPSVSGQAKKGGASGGVTTNGIAYASGFAGGSGDTNSGGGGAGAAASGGNGNSNGGVGGAGRTSDITGGSVEYAGGGGGACGGAGFNDRTGGAGAFGGGAGGSYSENHNPKIANAGSGRAGSGAGGGGSTSSASGAGGSGIVVMRFTIGGGGTPSEEPPTVEGGGEIDFERDMIDNEVVNSSKTVVFPSEPLVVGNAITYGGKTVEMPAHYQITVVPSGDAWKLTLTLDAEKVRPEVDGQAAEPFKVESGTVKLVIDNPIDGLYYGVKAAASLTDNFAPSGKLTQGSELKDNSLTVNRDPSATTQFYRLYVTDVPNGSDSF